MAAGSWQPASQPLREPACRPSRVVDVQGCPRGVWASLQYWRADWPLGSSLMPLRDPQAWATLSSPARRAQGGLLDSAPEAPRSSRGLFFRARTASSSTRNILALARRVPNRRQPPLPQPTFKPGPALLTLVCAPSCRFGCRRFFDALDAPPTLPSTPKHGGTRSRAQGRLRAVFLWSVWHVSGASARKKNGRGRWLCRRHARAVCILVFVLVIYEPI